MRFVNKALTGIGVLAVIGGIGFTAVPANAAPAKVASHSVAQKVQATIAPKPPTSGNASANCSYVTVSGTTETYNCGGNYRVANPVGNSVAVAADDYVQVSGNYQNVQASDVKTTDGQPMTISFYCYDGTNHTSTAAYWTRSGLYHITAANMSGYGRFGCSGYNHGIILAITKPACGGTYRTDVYLGSTPPYDGPNDYAHRGAFPWRVCTT